MSDTTSSKQTYSLQVDNLLLHLFIDARRNPVDLRLVSSLHTHSYTEIFVCKSGKISITSEQQSTVLSAGEMAIVPAGVLHVKMTADDASEWINIGVLCAPCPGESSRDLYTKISHLTGKNEIAVYTVAPCFYDIIKKIRDSVDVEQEPSPLLDFLSALSKLSDSSCCEIPSAKERTKSKIKNMDRLLKLDHFISYEFMHPLTNEKIAAALHIGERQLSRLVLNHYGTTLHTLILRKRISVAAKLLIESSDTVENIAFAVGFNGKMNFYREFKKVYGVTPMRYRNSNPSLPTILPTKQK